MGEIRKGKKTPTTILKIFLSKGFFDGKVTISSDQMDFALSTQYMSQEVFVMEFKNKLAVVLLTEHWAHLVS